MTACIRYTVNKDTPMDYVYLCMRGVFTGETYYDFNIYKVLNIFLVSIVLRIISFVPLYF